MSTLPRLYTPDRVNLRQAIRKARSDHKRDTEGHLSSWVKHISFNEHVVKVQDVLLKRDSARSSSEEGFERKFAHNLERVALGLSMEELQYYEQRQLGDIDDETNDLEFQCLKALWNAEQDVSGNVKEQMKRLRTLRDALDQASEAPTPPESIVDFEDDHPLFNYENPGGTVILTQPHSHTDYLDDCDEAEIPSTPGE